jgi:hypothetical protein
MFNNPKSDKSKARESPLTSVEECSATSTFKLADILSFSEIPLGRFRRKLEKKSELI